MNLTPSGGGGGGEKPPPGFFAGNRLKPGDIELKLSGFVNRTIAHKLTDLLQVRPGQVTRRDHRITWPDSQKVWRHATATILVRFI